MGILDDLNAPTAKQWSCRVRTIAEQLDPSDAAAFTAAVNDPAWKYTILADELRKRGLQISAPTIRAHRTGACSCSRI